jgi:hypothetical protein
MFEKIGRAAEGLATNAGVSRRGFLGRLGDGALAAAALLGGVFASSATAQSGVVCCKYSCKGGYRGGPLVVCQGPIGSTCFPGVLGGAGEPCDLISQFTRPSCKSC